MSLDMSDPTYLLWAQAQKKAMQIPQDLVAPKRQPPKPEPDPFMEELIEQVGNNLRAARGWCAPSEVTYGPDAV